MTRLLFLFGAEKCIECMFAIIAAAASAAAIASCDDDVVILMAFRGLLVVEAAVVVVCLIDASVLSSNRELVAESDRSVASVVDGSLLNRLLFDDKTSLFSTLESNWLSFLLISFSVISSKVEIILDFVVAILNGVVCSGLDLVALGSRVACDSVRSSSLFRADA